MISRIASRLRRLRHRISRSEWVRRLFGLSCDTPTQDASGLILVQIDGLAKIQFEKAVSENRLPFLRQLIEQDEHRVHPLYSGLPSTTPAVQGELLYGVRTAVPAFQFRDADTGQLTSLFSQEMARKIETRLSSRGIPALDAGSSYSNIYTAGAKESGFCAAAIGPSVAWRKRSLFRWCTVLPLYAFRFLRVGILFLLECVLAVYDLLRGTLRGRDWAYELAFIPKRLLVGIVLREIVTECARIDALRGRPIILVNFLGYDEQSHRRGPKSRFAHWTLKGIDRSIRSIWQAARMSSIREYDLWVYSDHGQEDAAWYSTETGRSFAEAVDAVFERYAETSENENRDTMARSNATGESDGRHAWFGGDRLQRILRWPTNEPQTHHVQVASMGPVAHVYAPAPLSSGETETLARALAEEASVPLVLTRGKEHSGRVWRPGQPHFFPGDDPESYGLSRPDAQRIITDLANLVHHADAGDFVCLGWRPGQAPLTFANENGAHGGFGPEETGAFALLPPDAPLENSAGDTLRPLDLHGAIMRFRKNGPFFRSQPAAETPARPRTPAKTLRVMTFNIHGCVGLDGRCSPSRVARLIARINPDLVALQEVDRNRPRSGDLDQAHMIADALNLHYHFHPALRIREEAYGNAILSRYPLRVIRADALEAEPGSEPRGALWVEADVEGQTIHCINTHLGLVTKARTRQVADLCAGQWLPAALQHDPVVFLGDLNTPPDSKAYRTIAALLSDSCKAVHAAKATRTWMGVRQLDYIWTSQQISVECVRMAEGHLARVTSDHRPLWADLIVE